MVKDSILEARSVSEHFPAGYIDFWTHAATPRHSEQDCGFDPKTLQSLT